MAAINIRRSARSSILRIKAEVDADGYTPDEVQVEHTITTLASHYNRFMENHMVLVGEATAEELDAHEELLAQVENIYGSIVTKLQRIRVAANTTTHFASSRCQTEHRLDPVKLPTFDGKQENWLMFKDVFESMVHNRTELDDTYKLSRLRQCVDAQAVPMVGGVYTGGYDQLWAELKRRYDNPRRLVESHVNRLLDLPEHPPLTQRNVRNVIDVVRSTLRALNVMGLATDQWDAIIYPIVLRKLPTSAVTHWTVLNHSDTLPQLTNMLEEIETYADTLRSNSTAPPQPRHSTTYRSAQSHVVTPKSANANMRSTCPRCSESHRLNKCPQFRALNLDQRLQMVRQASLCFNCLGAGHSVRDCNSGNCNNCKQKHNTLLCKAASLGERAPTNTSSVSQPQSATGTTAPQVLPRLDNVQSLLAHSEGIVLLATAKALIVDGLGDEVDCRLLCDMGSQVSFITEQFFNRLGLHRRRYALTVEGIGSHGSTVSRGQTTLVMRSYHDANFECCFDAHILPNITSIIPSSPIDMSQYKHLQGIPLADPTFNTPGGIDVLIGADILGMLLLGDTIISGPKQPCALYTRLGWVICGPTSPRCISLPALSTHSEHGAGEERLDDILQRFWELEDAPHPKTTDDICERIFLQTVSRKPDGRYIVQIPFTPNAPQLGDSYVNAMRNFFNLEKRLGKDNQLRSKYVEFMREYEALGHMEKMTPERSGYFIPHHAVTSKFRVVFNASAKTSNGFSLNDTQLVGPAVQDPLFDILARFRRFRVAITADIEKMFRQIEVDPRHRCWQQILWRETPSDPLCTYQLKTITYGMACSPFNAARVLNLCATDNQISVPDVERATRARNNILHSFYMDDLLDSVDTEDEAITLAHDITTILERGHFRLCKWKSNRTKLLAAISDTGLSTSALSLGDTEAKVLGLHWEPSDDELLFRVTLEDCNPIPTKRQVLSEVAKIFDPLGLLAPITVTAKMMMQLTWAAKVDWDTPLPPDLREKWLKFRSTLPSISTLHIPRWIGMENSATTTLHGFCDASEKAYAAVIYSRTVDTDGEVRVRLVAAKTKVSPLKTVTIPRLELCAAHLLTIAMVSIREALQLNKNQCVYWSDSTIALSWIRKPPHTFMQYVSNRVAYIQQHTNLSNWHHIRTQDNPADCASRGMTPSALKEWPLWWTGPPIIHRHTYEQEEIITLSNPEQQGHDAELRPVKAHACTTKVPTLQVRLANGSTNVIPLVERFSTLQRVLHTTAYVLRFRPAGRSHWHTPVISAEEIHDAFTLLVREAQGKFYNSEINLFRTTSSVPTSSKLLSLSPILGEDGVLRVGGRLRNSDLPYEQRHPIILPKECTLATLLVRNAHNVTLHGGIREMLQYLRRDLWIVHVRALVKRCIHQCKTCRLHQRAMQQQQMADLPRSRVLVAPPFSNTGLDYAGPFLVRHGGKRSTTTTKTYAATFICMCSKAVHIELAEDLSTRAFLDVFDRFVSRRGYCVNLYSDNGTQFVGANRQLQTDLANWNNTYSKQQLSDAGVRWHFITPSAPHQGGLWEAAVRSAKKHLKRVIGETILTYTQLGTLLVRIEACLNSRPIIALHDDPEGGVALSPGDFLVGRPLNSRPEAGLPDAPDNRLKYYQRWQRMLQHFWQRWKEEYLVQQQARSKWARPTPNLQVGDIVAIQNEHLPPSRWRIGRITEVHPGSDGLVRVVTIEFRTFERGLYRKHVCQRPIQRVCRIIDSSEGILSPQDSAGEDV